MLLAEKLAYLKKKRRLTNEELARQAQVPLGTVNKICAGQTKRPSLDSVARICGVFQVPIDYLMDDRVPPECDIAAYEASAGVSLISPEEASYLKKYRGLDCHSRIALDMLLDRFSAQAPAEDGGLPARRLLCYILQDCEQSSTLWENCLYRPMLLPLDAVSEWADFAVQILGESLVPLFEPGSVLLFRHTDAKHDQVGLFLVNRQVILRRYCRRRGLHRLVGMRNGVRDICLPDASAFQCLGRLLGAARTYRWL